MFDSRLVPISGAAAAILCAGFAVSTPALAITTPAHASCTTRWQGPELLTGFAPQRPLFAVDAGYFGITSVRVDLDAAGNVQGASIYKTSGYKVLDDDAVKVARAATYAPEKVDCQGVAGSYREDVSYDQ